MRTVPRNASLSPVLPRCSTKLGRSTDPACGSQSTAFPLRPAMEVNVPHSWAVRSGFVARAWASEWPGHAKKNTIRPKTTDRAKIGGMRWALRYAYSLLDDAGAFDVSE